MRQPRQRVPDELAHRLRRRRAPRLAILTRRALLATGLLLPLAYQARSVGLITSSGPRLFTSSEGGGEEGWPTTADKYVAESGSDAAAGTSGAPYATIAFGLSQISAGQSLMVLGNISENLALGSLTAGSAGNFKRVIADTPGNTITGTVSSTGGASKYISFEGLHWLHGSSEHDCFDVKQIKFLWCGFQGGIASAGNTVTHLAGSEQLYENCYWITAGGRYASLCFEQTGTLYRWCIVRTDNWGSPGDDGNPSAGIQLYSSDDCAMIQCVAVDCINQRSNNEWLAGLSVTTNTSASTGILHQECFVVNCAASNIGIQIEGSNALTYQGLGNVSVGNSYGLVENMDDSGGTITITGGEYSENDSDGIASFGVETVTVGSVNTSGNGSQNLRGTSSAGGNTTNALNMNSIVTNMVKRGVSGTMYGETGWNTQQGGEFMFPLPVESLARTKYLAFNAARGFTSAASLTDYLKAYTG